MQWFERDVVGSIQVVWLYLLQVRQIRNTLSSSDWLFLNACLAIVNGDESALKAYLRQDGDKARQLTKDECLVLGPTFTVGSTLVHLAIRFQRSDLLGLLLTPAHSDARKRLPSESNVDLASNIREELSRSLHQHKAGDWPCYYTSQLNTFVLPNGIHADSLNTISEYLLGTFLSFRNLLLLLCSTEACIR